MLGRASGRWTGHGVTLVPVILWLTQGSLRPINYHQSHGPADPARSSNPVSQKIEGLLLPALLLRRPNRCLLQTQPLGRPTQNAKVTSAPPLAKIQVQAQRLYPGKTSITIMERETPDQRPPASSSRSSLAQVLSTSASTATPEIHVAAVFDFISIHPCPGGGWL